MYLVAQQGLNALQRRPQGQREPHLVGFPFAFPFPCTTGVLVVDVVLVVVVVVLVVGVEAVVVVVDAVVVGDGAAPVLVRIIAVVGASVTDDVVVPDGVV